MNKSNDKARSYILTLLMIADADNQRFSTEMGFIYHIAERLNVSEKEVNELMKGDTDIKYDLPKNELDRMMLLHELFFLMKIDGSVSEEERNLFRDLGYLLTFNKLLVDEFLSAAVKYAGKPVPSNMLLNIIRKYKN